MDTEKLRSDLLSSNPLDVEYALYEIEHDTEIPPEDGIIVYQTARQRTVELTPDSLPSLRIPIRLFLAYALLMTKQNKYSVVEGVLEDARNYIEELINHSIQQQFLEIITQDFYSFLITSFADRLEKAIDEKDQENVERLLHTYLTIGRVRTKKEHGSDRDDTSESYAVKIAQENHLYELLIPKLRDKEILKNEKNRYMSAINIIEKDNPWVESTISIEQERLRLIDPTYPSSTLPQQFLDLFIRLNVLEKESVVYSFFTKEDLSTEEVEYLSHLISESISDFAYLMPHLSRLISLITKENLSLPLQKRLLLLPHLYPLSEDSQKKIFHTIEESFTHDSLFSIGVILFYEGYLTLLELEEITATPHLEKHHLQ